MHYTMSIFANRLPGQNASSSRSSRSSGPSHRPSLISMVKAINLQSPEDQDQMNSTIPLTEEVIKQIYQALFSNFVFLISGKMLILESIKSEPYKRLN
jgi:hypothetical protein